MPNLDFHFNFIGYYITFFKKIIFKINNTNDRQNDRHCDKTESPLCSVDRYSPENMHTCLEELAAEEELTLEEIPTVKTIKGWIGRYSANFKKKASERALVENNTESTTIAGSSSQKRLYKRQKKN